MFNKEKDYSKRIFVQKIIFIVLVIIFLGIFAQFVFSENIRFQGNSVKNLLIINNTGDQFEIIKNNILRLSINSTTSSFKGDLQNVDDFNGPSRYTERNINSGVNASANIILENNIGSKCMFSLGSSNYQLMGLNLSNTPGIICFVDTDFIHLNSFPVGWKWVKQKVGAVTLSMNTIDYETLMEIDNDGNLTILGDFIGNQIYGEMFTNIGSTPTTFSSSGVFVPVVNDLEIGSVNGFTFSAGNLTALFSGTYKAFYGVSYTGNNNNVIKFTMGVNGIPSSKCQTEETIDGGGITIDSDRSCFISVSSGDTVQLLVQNTASTQSITIKEANINLVRIGD